MTAALASLFWSKENLWHSYPIHNKRNNTLCFQAADPATTIKSLLIGHWLCCSFTPQKFHAVIGFLYIRLTNWGLNAKHRPYAPKTASSLVCDKSINSLQSSGSESCRQTMLAFKSNKITFHDENLDRILIAVTKPRNHNISLVVDFKSWAWSFSSRGMKTI